MRLMNNGSGDSGTIDEGLDMAQKGRRHARTLQSGAAAAADVDGVGRQLRQELVALGAAHHANPRDRLRVGFHAQLAPPSPKAHSFWPSHAPLRHQPKKQAGRSKNPQEAASVQSTEDPTDQSKDIPAKEGACEPHEAATAAVELKGRRKSGMVEEKRCRRREREMEGGRGRPGGCEFNMVRQSRAILLAWSLTLMRTQLSLFSLSLASSCAPVLRDKARARGGQEILRKKE
jgi:hypothetical protein